MYSIALMHFRRETMLREFFRCGMSDPLPTEEEVECNLHTLLYGHKDGRIVIENEAPHLTGSKQEVKRRNAQGASSV